jgi:myo-inositol-1(or 4)-monophosphatase
MIDYSPRLKTAEIAARQAGEYLLKVLPDKRQIDKKGVVNLVTEADRGSEKLIHEIISQAFPGDRFLSEEGTKTPGQSELIWLVDPLDGTTNYAHRLPHFCISIGLVESGVPVVGCIYNPSLNECFTAQKDGGAFLNCEPVHVSSTGELTDALLATGFPYDVRETDDDNLVNFAMFYKKAQAVRRAGAAALDLAHVACGRFDGFWEFKLSGWDIAAGILLVREASGMVSDFSGGQVDIFKGEVVASNGIVHEQIIRTLRKARQIQSNFNFHSQLGIGEE